MDDTTDLVTDSIKDIQALWKSADTAPWSACEELGERTTPEHLQILYPTGLPHTAWETPYGYYVCVIRIVDTYDQAAVIIDGPNTIHAWRDLTLSTLHRCIQGYDGFEGIEIGIDELDWFSGQYC